MVFAPYLTYSHERRLSRGTRVLVTLRGKTVAGIVGGWEDVPPSYDVLPIKQVLPEPTLPESWLDLVEFCARYYVYPLGATAFTALPAGLRRAAPYSPPEPPAYFLPTDRITEPPVSHRRRHALWQTLQHGGIPSGSLKTSDKAIVMKWLEEGAVITQPLPPYQRHAGEFSLNAMQRSAADAIIAAQGFVPFVLAGVTGSGKTEVYFAAAEAALEQGGQVLLLVPEINLTPQLLSRLATRFPHTATAVLHSGATDAARTHDFLRASLGQAVLVVGTRSAVFVPLPKLALVIVDEEHDQSFKQDSELKYHARDLAVWRAKQADCPIVLGSATPSLETWKNVRTERYRLLRLPERANPAARMPHIETVDMNLCAQQDGLSERAISLLRETHTRGGMSLVYINRRGFSPVVYCADCHHVIGCPHCSSKMVYHRTNASMICHHCRYETIVPSHCPQCGSVDLNAVGYGTQRIEEILPNVVPDARILRIDRDAIGTHQWNQTFEDIRNGGADILVGTQMLAKGHDFANLDSVIVINADAGLFSTDFRASERLFAELMQVSGRAGRAAREGRVLIQTRVPNHRIFDALRRHDYETFADDCLEERLDADLPPWRFSALIRVDAPKETAGKSILETAAAQIRLPENVRATLPFRASLSRLAGRTRWQVCLDSRERVLLHNALWQWRQVLDSMVGVMRPDSARYSIDVDPLDY